MLVWYTSRFLLMLGYVLWASAVYVAIMFLLWFLEVIGCRIKHQLISLSFDLHDVQTDGTYNLLHSSHNKWDVGWHFNFFLKDVSHFLLTDGSGPSFHMYIIIYTSGYFIWCNLYAAPILFCRYCNWVVSLSIYDTYMGSVALIFYFPNDVQIEADTDGNGHITYD